jgi:hypothetical protein
MSSGDSTSTRVENCAREWAQRRSRECAACGNAWAWARVFDCVAPRGRRRQPRRVRGARARACLLPNLDERGPQAQQALAQPGGLRDEASLLALLREATLAEVGPLQVERHALEHKLEHEAPDFEGALARCARVWR